MSEQIQEINDVTVGVLANVYFDGKVVSHSIRLADGSRKTLGLIYPGEFHFGTGAPERMEIVAGDCVVRIDGEEDTKNYSGGSSFDVAGNSGFSISVNKGICQYVCSFL